MCRSHFSFSSKSWIWHVQNGLLYYILLVFKILDLALTDYDAQNGLLVLVLCLSLQSHGYNCIFISHEDGH